MGRKSRAAKTSNIRRENKRAKKRVLLVLCEGTKTEKVYFTALAKKYRDTSIQLKFVDNNKTDPVNLVKKAKEKYREYDLNREDGDICYVVFDKDANTCEKINDALKNTSKGKEEVKLIFSNPSFEMWYLLHFEYTTSCSNAQEMITKLSKHISNYSKTKDYFKMLEPHTDTAIKNAKKLEDYYSDTKYCEKNPYTEVYKILENLMVV